MNNKPTLPTASDLLDVLSVTNKETDDARSIESFIVSYHENKELPLYLRALIGVGAFFASLCLIGLVVAGMSITSESGIIISGMLFIGLAIFLLKICANDNSIKHSFITQSSFSFMAAGKLLFTAGVAINVSSQWGIPLALFFITIATYHVYTMSVDRFLSVLGFFASIFFNVLFGNETAGQRELILNGLVFVQIIVCGFLLLHVRVEQKYKPIAYALVFSLIINVLYLSAQNEVGFWRDKEFIHLDFITLLLSLSLIFVIAWLVGSAKSLASEPCIIACVGVVLLGVISAPGVLLSIIIMVLGYAKHERFLMLVGAVLIPPFIFLYYFNLDISLLEKSGVLIGSGTALLIGHFYMSVKGWSKEVAK